ncbi:uncharacterized protein LOC106378772 [Brassica napus]|uniref:uncharacterized protein LOC106378772 n=1 Tax=Brassica napus TaxID=3708 RepID=UPI0006AA9C86|nr:uncharacterized protein LOC106378772 [Brassica napus]
MENSVLSKFALGPVGAVLSDSKGIVLVSEYELKSWVWHKLLKLGDLAKQFFRREVRNGRETSFWYDSWSKLGCLKDVIGERGCIALGISDKAVVADVLSKHRRRRHRESRLNEIENELEALRNGDIDHLQRTSLPPTKKFLIRYTFQATVHALWRELNARRHGEQPQTVNVITKFVDKTIRLKLLSVKELGQKYLEESLTTWFATRERPP